MGKGNCIFTFFTAQIVRIVLIALNVVFLIAGIALIGIGAYLKSHSNIFDNAIPQDYSFIKQAPWIIIGLGCAIGIVAFLGFWGAFKTNKLFLIAYAAVLSALFLVKLVIAICLLIKVKSKIDFTPKIEEALKPIFEDYKNTPAHKEITDNIQSYAKCCGITGPGWWKTIGQPIPSSCLKKGKKDPQEDEKKTEKTSRADDDKAKPAETTEIPNSEAYHSTACPNVMSDLITKYTKIMGYFLVVVGAFELGAAIFAAFLCKCG